MRNLIPHCSKGYASDLMEEVMIAADAVRTARKAVGRSDVLVDGVDTETVEDFDVMRANKPVESLDDLVNEIV